MPTDDDTRSLGQQAAAGESEATPVALLGSVAGVIAAIFVVVVALAALAYFLA